MSKLQTIDEHMIIRETIGYDVISEFEIHDLPVVLDFLKVVWNYRKMCEIEKKLKKAEEIPQEYVDIVNENFWNLI